MLHSRIGSIKKAPGVAAPGAFFVQVKFARGNFYKNMQVFAYYICKWLDDEI